MLKLPAPTRLDLWTGKPPDWNPADDRPYPFLDYYAQPEAGAPLMIVFPGGGYNVCSEMEGLSAVRYYYEAGFDAVYVQYRTQYHSAPLPLGGGPLQDAAQAIRSLESRRFSFDRSRTAAIGFSAGGHLAASLALYSQTLEPALPWLPQTFILAYPVITTGEFCHTGSARNLCGTEPPAAALEYWSLEKQVHSGVPPMFLWHTAEDQSVPPQNSLYFADALSRAGVPFELHVFPQGQHGVHMASETYPALNVWAAMSLTWLETVWAGALGPETAAGAE